ncbi:DUF2066 domain-containing protein [Shewanella sp. SHSM-M6]|uniref:DUF2066 domain-containing protein n=2 Tax=Shewanella salipaludis TaxID=2723052 RepID=A0A972G403_9GAMM|nr:DUF2066 domain-containing protein [Shewanella salipaludis]
MLKILSKATLFLCVYSLLSIGNVMAIEVSQLADAEVAVASRDAGERHQGLKTALQQVILKNAGDEAVLDNELIRAQLKSPEALLSQYGYVERDAKLWLQASYDRSRIIALLRQANLPVWGSQRPLTLVWLAMENQEERLVLGDASALAERQQFSQFSAERGVPLLFPLMDLDDVMRVGVADVRGMFTEVVASASARYQADFFAIAALEPVAGSIKYQLSLFPKGSAGVGTQPAFYHQGETADSAAAINEMMSALSRYFVAQYAIADSGEKQQSSVTFTGINQMKQLVEIEKYLQQLSVVNTTKLSRVQGDTVTFKLELFGSEADLQRLLSLEPKISVTQDAAQHNPPAQFSADAAQVSSGAPLLLYRWRLQ